MSLTTVRSRLGSDNPPDCHSLPRRRCATHIVPQNHKKLKKTCRGGSPCPPEETKVNDMLFKSIKQVIDEWDPIGLLDFAPDDEYVEECQQIFENYCNDTNQLGEVIFNIFKKSFEDSFTKNKEDCIDIAKMIQDNLAP